MPSKRAVVCVAIALAAPVVFGAVSVAAGHVVPGNFDVPLGFFAYRIDRVITAVNAVASAATAGLIVCLLPLRPRFRAVLAVLSSLVSLPVYVFAYLSSFQVIEWLGLGWASS